MRGWINILLILIVIISGCIQTSKLDRETYSTYIKYLRQFNEDVDTINKFAEEWKNVNDTNIIHAVEIYVDAYKKAMKNILSFRKFLNSTRDELEKLGINTIEIERYVDEFENTLKENLRRIKENSLNKSYEKDVIKILKEVI